MPGGDPYARIAAVLRGQGGETLQEQKTVGLGLAPCRMRLGAVTSRVPLKVKVAGIEQPAEVLRINERLTRGAKRKIKFTSYDADYQGLSGELEGPVSCAGGCGSPQLSAVTDGDLHAGFTQIRDAEDEQLEIDLAVDDVVLMLTEDDQVFYILMKVVDAE